MQKNKLFKMKAFVIVALLAVSAYGAKLDNRYIPPPPNAQSAGGFNLETPKQALPSNVQNTYVQSPGGVQTQYQQQQVQRPGLNQGTFTSQSHGNGFQGVSAGSFSSNTGGQRQLQQQSFQQQQSYQPQQQQQSYQPQQQQSFQPQQPAFQQPQQPVYQQQQKQQHQSSYQPQPQYNQQQGGGYNQASTTPIPILKCEYFFLQ